MPEQELAVIYTRFSPRPKTKKSNKLEDGETTECQLKVCRQYAQMKGFRVSAECCDEYESGRKTNLWDRPAGQNLEFFNDGNVKHIIVAKMDRLFRDTVNGLQMMDHYQQAGVSIHLANEGGNSLNLSTSLGRLFVTMRLGVAEFEARQTSERTKELMLHRQSNGERMSHKDKIPYGKMIDPNDPSRIVDCDKELEMIDRVKLLRSYGYTLRGIAAEMQAELGHLRGKPWHPQKVKSMLKAGE